MFLRLVTFAPIDSIWPNGKTELINWKVQNHVTQNALVLQYTDGGSI